MREVDEVLARTYGERDHRQLPKGVPPAPHLPGHALAPGTEPVVAESRPGLVAELQWPGIVLSLERECGERFEHMAELLLAARQRHRTKVILFTSCHRAEGRTTLVLSLARCLSRRPFRTVVVDGDLTGPMIGRLLGLRPQIGLDDVVEAGEPLSESLIEAGDDHLVILPMRSAVARPRDFLVKPAWTCSLARLRREFHLILIDGGPLFTGLNAAVLHRSVDAAVLVHHQGVSGPRAILRAREVLDAGGVPLLGVAETFV
jgi:Mrp family chromosome partitioning ATPase